MICLLLFNHSVFVINCKLYTQRVLWARATDYLTSSRIGQSCYTYSKVHSGGILYALWSSVIICALYFVSNISRRIVQKSIIITVRTTYTAYADVTLKSPLRILSHLVSWSLIPYGASASSSYTRRDLWCRLFATVHFIRNIRSRKYVFTAHELHVRVFFIYEYERNIHNINAFEFHEFSAAFT